MTIRTLPSICSDQFLPAIKEAVEVLAGYRGDSSDKAITIADLSTNAVASIIKDKTTQLQHLDRGVADQVRIPSPPTDLKILPESDATRINVFSHHLVWTNPVDENVVGVQVWMNYSDSLSGAVHLATVSYTENLPTTGGYVYDNPSPTQNHYYWIRSIDWAGHYSTWEPDPGQGGYVVPKETTIAQTIEKLMNALKGEAPALWSSTTTYAEGDQVTYERTDGATAAYISLQDSNLNKNPETETTYWKRHGILIEGDIDGVSTIGIDGNLVVDGTIITQALAAGSITAEKIAAGAITVLGSTSGYHAIIEGTGLKIYSGTTLLASYSSTASKYYGGGKEVLSIDSEGIANLSFYKSGAINFVEDLVSPAVINWGDVASLSCTALTDMQLVDVWSDDTYFYVLGRYGIFTMSVNPSTGAFTRVSYINLYNDFGNCVRIFGYGSYVFVVTEGYVVSLSSSSGKLTLVDSDDTPTDGRDVWVCNTHVFVADNDLGIITYTHSAGFLTYKSTVAVSSPYPVSVYGDGSSYIFVGCESGYVRSYSLGNTPSYIDYEVADVAAIYDITILNNILYTLGVNKLSSFTYSGGSFSLVDDDNNPSWGRSICSATVSGTDYLYVANYDVVGVQTFSSASGTLTYIDNDITPSENLYAVWCDDNLIVAVDYDIEGGVYSYTHLSGTITYKETDELSSGTGLAIYPETAQIGNFFLGYDIVNSEDKPFYSINFKAYNFFGAKAEYNPDNYAKIEIAGVSGGSYLTLITNAGGTQKILSMYGGAVYPAVYRDLDLGLSASYAWDQFYVYNINEEADEFILDDRNDLEEMAKIKGSGIFDELTGFELIDDNTLPEWSLARYNKNICDSKGKLEHVKGEIMISPDNKPFTSNRMWRAWFRGTIMQMYKKYREFKADYEALKIDYEILKQSLIREI